MGLPGRMATFQKSSVTPCFESRVDEVVVADGGAADGDDDVGVGRCELRGEVRDACRLRCRAARCAATERSAPPGRTASRRRSARGRARAGLTSSSPVARMATRRPAHGPASACRPRRRARCRGVEPAPGVQHHPAWSRRQRAGCWRRLGRLADDHDIAARASVLLDEHGVGAIGNRRAGEDADRLAGADRALERSPAADSPTT